MQPPVSLHGGSRNPRAAVCCEQVAERAMAGASASGTLKTGAARVQTTLSLASIGASPNRLVVAGIPASVAGPETLIAMRWRSPTATGLSNGSNGTTSPTAPVPVRPWSAWMRPVGFTPLPPAVRTTTTASPSSPWQRQSALPHLACASRGASVRAARESRIATSGRMGPPRELPPE